jgi:hypothetical protein
VIRECVRPQESSGPVPLVFSATVLGDGGPVPNRFQNAARATRPDLAYKRKRPRFQGLSQWARLGSNQRPLACEASALPLSYAPGGVDSSRRSGGA